MPFDETKYVEVFIKRHRSARVVPGDLISRYAITLPATDAEISGRIKAVRDYWNRVSAGDSIAARIARMCRAEDKQLRAEHGAEMETSAWWRRQQSARQSAIGVSIDNAAVSLKQEYGPLGMVTTGILDQLAAKFNLTRGQARRAAQIAGLQLVTGVPRPDAEPIADFAVLVQRLSDCGAASVPDLVHPGAGPFSIIGRYACRDDPGKRLDEAAVAARATEAMAHVGSPVVNARLAALEFLRKALDREVDLRDVALYHLMTVADGLRPAGAAVAELQRRGLELADARIVALLAAEDGAGAGLSVLPVEPGPRSGTEGASRNLGVSGRS